jgi:hypothetical protein
LLYVLDFVFGIFQIDNFNSDFLASLLVNSFVNFTEGTLADALSFLV